MFSYITHSIHYLTPISIFQIHPKLNISHDFHHYLPSPRSHPLSLRLQKPLLKNPPVSILAFPGQIVHMEVRVIFKDLSHITSLPQTLSFCVKLYLKQNSKCLLWRPYTIHPTYILTSNLTNPQLPSLFCSGYSAFLVLCWTRQPHSHSGVNWIISTLPSWIISTLPSFKKDPLLVLSYYHHVVTAHHYFSNWMDSKFN